MKHIGTQTIETDRLLLRRYEMTDADDMFRNWVTDPEVSRFWGWKPHENIERTKSLLEGWIHDYTKADNYHWVIIFKELTEAIGYIYLNEICDEKKSASIHFLVCRSMWNQGMMTEACIAVLKFAFDRIGISTVHSHHHVDNPASGRVMQKTGMRYLETKYKEVPDCVEMSGDYCFYEITTEDWMRT